MNADGATDFGLPASVTPVAETARLRLRRLDFADAPFILVLLNDPGWLRHIGDKNVHSLADARRYLAEGPMAMVARHGFGLYLVERRADGRPLGLCGLLRRDTLPQADIGFAFLPEFRGQGYAFEAAQAVLDHARRDFGFGGLLAITAPDNTASGRLLEKLGLRLQGLVRLTPDSPEAKLYSIDFAAADA